MESNIAYKSIMLSVSSFVRLINTASVSHSDVELEQRLLKAKFLLT